MEAPRPRDHVAAMSRSLARLASLATGIMLTAVSGCNDEPPLPPIVWEGEHLRFGMPAYSLAWVDTALPDLGWAQGVVQFGHHSYNPTKECPDCTPNTWHWDNVTIDPAVPFNITRGDRRYVDAADQALRERRHVDVAVRVADQRLP